MVVRPLFDLIAFSRNEEVFTAMALFVALAAGWATGAVGLSLTLGAFLGGMIVAETPYSPIIQSEIKPFRGLLVGFFFISVGMSLDVGTLLRFWPAVIGVAVLLLAVKILTNAAASLAFRWSVPGSTQLGFLLAQGSEFAFVILSLPPVRRLVGGQASSVLIAAVALTLAATPSLAEVGRSLAGGMRRRAARAADPELVPRDVAAPVFIAGMGRVGRTLADSLHEFGIGYAAIERDDKRLREAVADGYSVVFGDIGDPRIWEPVALHGRRLNVLTAPSFEVSQGVSPIARARYPDLKRIAVVHTDADAERFRSIGVQPVIDRSVPPGLDLTALVLSELGVEAERIGDWMRRSQQSVLGGEAQVVAA
jgi:CPA2 family monovalent cation:H+ antiporter-2